MKKIFKALKITSTLLFITVAFIACDKDFTSIESDIQGSENFNTNSIKFPVTAYNKKLNAVQTNGLSSNLLGIYNDEIYGQTTASVVSQLTPTTYNPNFGDDPEISSVILTIPYFSTEDGTDVDGNVIYTMTAKDSLYGSAPVELYIYKNNYFLSDIDSENVEDAKKYYSNGNNIDFDGVHRGVKLYENLNFTPSNAAVVIEEVDEETGLLEEVERTAPGLRVSLLNPGDDFWETLLFDHQDMPELSNANNFKNFFRGLYFKTNAIDGDGNMIMLNFKKANITVNYTYVTGSEIDDDGVAQDVRSDNDYVLNFSENRLSIFENDPINAIIANADAAANTTEGDETLYLKGGEGGMAIVNLFEGTINVEGVDYDSYDYFKNKKDSWLLNEAYLTFYVDQESGVITSQEPHRVMLYDVKNNTPLVDYFFDFTNASSPESSKIFHASPLIKDSNDNGEKYKIRLTEHINNILLKDSTNLELGLLVSTNINETLNNSILDSDNSIISGAIMSPKGTILHGSKENVPEAKRIQLEIYYTEPEN